MWPFNSRSVERQPETRSSIENPTVPVSAENFLSFFGVDMGRNLPNVTLDSALTVPAVAAAVAFLSRTLATLPLYAYRTSKAGPAKLTGKLQGVVHDAPNDLMDSFKFRQYFWQQVFTGGRGMAWIERTPQGVEALWPLDPTATVIKRVGHVVTYTYTDRTTPGRTIEYPAADIIDVPFMLRTNGFSHYGPIHLASKAIQLALAMNDYGSNFFAGGGVPPLALTGPLPAGSEAMKRAQADIKRAIEAAKNNSEAIFPIPPGMTLAPVGLDPAKGQMVEARLFQIKEVARAWQLPPVFLQDLTGSTFSNTEQQDLFLVKHLVGQWAQALEGEMNLKIFGRGNNGRFIRHDLDGLLRGDFASRMAGYAASVQNAVRTPNEIRALENLPAEPNGDKLYIQGATVPLGASAVTQPTNDNEPPPKAPADGDSKDDAA